MKYVPIKRGYVVRLYRDETLVESLTKFANEKMITCASLRGIGAVSFASFGYYDLQAKKYEFFERDEFMEVVSMQGNIAVLEGKSFLHVHGAFAGTDLSMYGGHIKEAVVGLTLEVFIDTYDIEVVRRYDEGIGLNLFELPCSFTKDHD